MTSASAYPPPTIGGKKFTFHSAGQGTFLMQAGRIQDIKMSDLAAWLEATWRLDLPLVTGGTTSITHLSLTITTVRTGTNDARDFTFTAHMNAPLEGIPAQMKELHIRYSPGGFHLRVTFSLLIGRKSALFSGVLDKDTTRGWAISASWGASDPLQTPVPFTDLTTMLT
ncbi:hypothetical protein [Streptomyces sp. NPDC037389]|uniref:hypothetical protein n=1 Tax=Streptomyces sp. NPDC037389 TaxID=3155369 RepID=UPI0033E3E7E0